MEVEETVARIRTELRLDKELLRLAEERAAATGRDRDDVIEEALRRQLQAHQLGELMQRVRTRSGLSEEQALELAYSELKAMRAERRAAS